jgi:SAM-dependent methyltransferase
MSSLQITNQWNDFLVRQVDPYAFCKYEILMGWLGNIKNKNILVIGSGSGEFAAWLAKEGARVTALDISQECIDLTLMTAKKFETKIKTVVSSIENYRTDEKFDYVVATDVIEHVEDDLNAIKTIESLLMKDGIVVITVPAMQWLFGFHDEALGHYRRYNKISLQNLFLEKFEIHHIRYYGLLLIPVALVISKWLRVPYPVQTVGEASVKKNILASVIRFFFKFEKFLAPPVGTSLLMIGKLK